MYFWATSRDLDFDVRIEAENLDDASDQIGMAINRAGVAGYTHRERERCVIINWRQVRTVVVTREQPETGKGAVGQPSDFLLRLELAEIEEADGDS